MSGSILVQDGRGPIRIGLSSSQPATVTSVGPAPIKAKIDAMGAPGLAGDRGLVGDRGPAGAASGFGWVDYTDTEAGVETPLLENVRTQVNRALVASPANNKLAGHWEGHAFWGGTSSDRKIIGVTPADSIALSFVFRVRPGRIGGVLLMEIDVGPPIGVVVPESRSLFGDVGEIATLRITSIFSMRTAFQANGGRVFLTSSVPATLVEFSPEFFPLGFTP